MKTNSTRGLMIASTGSGAGKTTFTLGLVSALKSSGINVVTAKSGPDYIDPQFLEAASGKSCINLDAWAMESSVIEGLVLDQTESAELLIVEAAMGLFDSAMNGTGSAADLAKLLSIPIVLVVDCSKMAQSIGALVHGFSTYRSDINVAGVILNQVASKRHEEMLRQALSNSDMPVLGAVYRSPSLSMPERHLGLVQASEHESLCGLIESTASLVKKHTDLDKLASLASPMSLNGSRNDLPPLGQNVAIARDQAFSFIYPHLIDGWRKSGANLHFFSPLADEPPPDKCDAIFLPGGYPELHATALAYADKFKQGMSTAAKKGTLIYGECGGYMCLGKTLTNESGIKYPMLGLLPHSTDFSEPKLQLGYRIIESVTNLPWKGALAAHEFHYSTIQEEENSNYLFQVRDAEGNNLPNMGHQSNNVMGSYIHVIGIKSK